MASVTQTYLQVIFGRLNLRRIGSFFSVGQGSRGCQGASREGGRGRKKKTLLARENVPDMLSSTFLLTGVELEGTIFTGPAMN